jgi:hypothetical protein
MANLKDAIKDVEKIIEAVLDFGIANIDNIYDEDIKQRYSEIYDKLTKLSKDLEVA